MKKFDKILKHIKIIDINEYTIGSFLSKNYNEPKNEYVFSNCIVYKKDNYIIIEFDDLIVNIKYDKFTEYLKDYLKYYNLINDETIINGDYIHNKKYSMNVKTNKIRFIDDEVDIDFIKDIFNKIN